MNKINVTGEGFELENRKNALKELEKADTETLQKLAKLLRTPQAKEKFKANYSVLKNFI